MITLHQVDKFYGRHDVLHEADFFLGPGEKVGLIGPNGAGKTTLIRLILGEVTPDRGEVFRPKDLRLGYLPQDLLTFAGRTVLGLVLDAAEEIRRLEAELAAVEKELNQTDDRERLTELAGRQGHLQSVFEHLGGYDLDSRARKLLEGLGFSPRDLDRPVEELSGGWIMRAALARLLLSRPDVLLLDEPTNYLDLDSILWLEATLKASDFSLLLISHDRTFLNNVVERIVEIDHGRLYSYPGGYDQYERQKAERIKSQASAYETQQEKIRQIQRFIDRNRTRKDRAAQVQGRLKMLSKMERIDPPQTEAREFTVQFPPAPRAPKVLVEVEAVRVDFGAEPVYHRLDFQLVRGDRLAFLGPNGHGKTTLMRLLAGKLRPTAGSVRIAPGVRAGYFAQHLLDQLHPDLTVLDELTTVAGDLTVGRRRQTLGGFLFSGDEVDKKVSVLSGGEKSRLVLCKLLVQNPNLLLLDEPTNHLDIAARRVLESALLGFDGTICLITHDRRLINAVAQKVVVVGQGRAAVYPGNFDDYQNVWLPRRRLGEPSGTELFRDLAPARPDRTGSEPTSPPPPLVRKTKKQKRTEALARQKRYETTRPLRQRLARLEKRIDQTGARLEQVQGELARPEIYQDPGRAKEYNERYSALKNEIDRLTEDWEQGVVELEKLEASLGTEA
ncbi:MAG: ABC-F family ATP-binding cassette domain-containing protein [Proteobacteria bacterium]|nr:ABC-F family ATP-binding cassette domain-containing protein [Pseudomonadota bacterium]